MKTIDLSRWKDVIAPEHCMDDVLLWDMTLRELHQLQRRHQHLVGWGQGDGVDTDGAAGSSAEYSREVEVTVTGLSHTPAFPRSPATDS